MLKDWFTDMSSMLAEKIEDKANRVVAKTEKEILILEAKLIKKFMAILIIASAIIFIAIAGFFALREYAGLSKTLSFLIFALALFVIGIIINYMSHERRYRYD